MGVINMAHGEMVMIGAYTTFVVQEVIRTRYPGLFDYSLLIAVPLAFIVAGALGVVIERSIIRFLYGRPLETLAGDLGSFAGVAAGRAYRFRSFQPRSRQPQSWMSGAFEIGQITITYNRLWILCFTMAVFVILLAMLRYTALGLEMRAVTQNRRMAASMGIATSRVDALTFGLGSGIAGIAGVALSQIDNVSPNLGQSYIIDSFMVVVFGGVGNLWGTLVGAFTLGIANKFLEPVAGAVLGKIGHSGADHSVHPEAAARPVRAQGPGGGSMMPHILTRSLDRSATVFILVVAGLGVLIPLSNLLLPAGSFFQVPTYLVALFGKYVCYAILALSIDLIWGYCGILSLGHGAFFALGGYAMGMYLMRQIGSRGVYGQPDPARLHGVPELSRAALVLEWLQPFLVRGADGAAGAGPARLRLRLAGVSLPRHRRLSLDYHASDDLCAAAGVLPQRLRLWRQQRPDRLQGHSRLQRAGRRHPRGAVLAQLPGAGHGRS